MRKNDIETKIETCTNRASAHALTARREGSIRERERATKQTRIHLVDRRTLRQESERLSQSITVMQRQVSSIINSHLDSVIVSAMRQYTRTASQLVRAPCACPTLLISLRPTLTWR
jgi:hypothetical protein